MTITLKTVALDIILAAAKRKGFKVPKNARRVLVAELIATRKADLQKIVAKRKRRIDPKSRMQHGLESMLRR